MILRVASHGGDIRIAYAVSTRGQGPVLLGIFVETKKDQRGSHSEFRGPNRPSD